MSAGSAVRATWCYPHSRNTGLGALPPPERLPATHRLLFPPPSQPLGRPALDDSLRLATPCLVGPSKSPLLPTPDVVEARRTCGRHDGVQARLPRCQG